MGRGSRQCLREDGQRKSAVSTGRWAEEVGSVYWKMGRGSRQCLRKDGQRKSAVSTGRWAEEVGKFWASVQEIHRPDRQKQYNSLGHSNSLPIKCASCHFCAVNLCILDWCDPTIKVYFQHAEKATTKKNVHARHPMMEAAEQDKNSVLLTAMVSHSSLTSASRRSPN